VEAYASRLTADGLAETALRARIASSELSHEGTDVVYERAIYLPADETCFYVFGAASVTDVETVSARAGLAVARIVQAVEQTFGDHAIVLEGRGR